MRLRLRARCPSVLGEFILKCLTYIIVAFTLCQRHICCVLCMVVVVCFLWWASSDGEKCFGHELVKHVCQEYKEKNVAGDMCDSLCNEKEIDIGSCTSYSDILQIFQNGDLVFSVQNDPFHSWLIDSIVEGTKLKRFVFDVDKHIQSELGLTDTSALMSRIIGDFDLNKDGNLNLGEAQSIWRLLKQPFFLAFYVFQDSTAVPHLNGSCGGISIWHRPHLTTGDNLYHSKGPWPLSLFSSHAYRWTLPAWHKRAKVMLSLLELVEEMYEKNGVRYHLCNVSGLTLYQLPNYEVTLSEEAMMLSSNQVAKRLANISCQSSSDCTLTHQCQTVCELTTAQCTGKLIRPTLAYVCDIMQDYLLFDAPRALKSTLTRLIHRCQNMSMHLPKLDLLHSVVVVDIKTVLWNTLQYSHA
ncbi:divergent protein kinase domain 1A-like [Biomphalaria glabrata]|uniref:Divergent protein kinase domain 1A-like n=1 Tax=Biomphalaria glabrata TaxID=6526 RepID=A0A9W3BAS2_BIOGL|nr:divergent protein kinase domain 1A-like [Biomphalaria glabrata]XP_055896523.1 divergent protein kinase domain 1A-like [Biomphalaria glabrata]XP_055896524.1 divergent protein kinase domain 1A-like [Biomphalaria glabrata]KAI8729338.1 divergent protein kinase domain 1A-like [Biomphalaria glabrata]